MSFENDVVSELRKTNRALLALGEEVRRIADSLEMQEMANATVKPPRKKVAVPDRLKK
jgi:hypothetical protein